MIELIITDRLYRKIVVRKKSPRLISMRFLTNREIMLARKLGIRRYYLPSLTKDESVEFLREFDKWWDQVIKPFDADHPFWRNVVSSKMQEWERSAAYFSLMLFTLAQKEMEESSQSIVIICSSLEEEDLCEEWGKKIGWKVYRRHHFLFPYWSRSIIQEISNINKFLYMLSVCIYKKWFSPKYKKKKNLIGKRNLIVSLFYADCFRNGEYQDHFFGNLHNTFKQNGNYVSYLSSPLGRFKETAKKIRDHNEVSIVIPYSIITWGELISLILKVFTRRIQFVRSAFFGVDFTKLLKWNVRRFEYFFNLDSEIFYTAVDKLCKNEHFNRLIQLYEGNVFERGSIQAFRKCSSGLIVGYSHGVIFPLNLKMRLTDNEAKHRPEPDVLVATGPESKHLMETIGNRKSTSKIYAACSLRYIPVIDLKKVAHTVQSNILVALDGVMASSTVLDWLFEHAEIFQDYKVKLRAHPNVPINILLTQCLYDVPANFLLSDNDLKEDIEKSFCVIYRQTSVGMQALMNGVPTIHLNINAPLPCDPIMNLAASKWSVRTPEELSTALQEIRSLREKDNRASIETAKKYVRDYFTIPDEKNITWFLAERDAINNLS